jgi:hypothetical protein
MAENWEKVARNLSYLDEKSMWVDLYLTQSLSIDEIHKRLDYGTHTIIRRLDHHGINRRSTGGARFSPNQRGKLFHLDQRVVWFLTIKELSNHTNISTALISKYKNYHEGEFDEFLHHYPNRWTGEVCNTIQDTLGVSPD